MTRLLLPFMVLIGGLLTENPPAPPGAAPPAATSVPMSHGHSAFEGDAARKRWNDVFSEKEPRFNTRPNSFLEYVLPRLPARGRAIDIAMGQGRNAIVLAKHGLETTGIDISDVAIEQARDGAKAAGVALDAVRDDVFTYDYGRDRWDVISVIYFNPARPILERFKTAVRPGGYVLIEGFGRRKQGGPPDDTKFETNELLRRFADWEILEYQDGDFDADWGGEKRAHVIRLLARKPMAANAAPTTAPAPR